FGLPMLSILPKALCILLKRKC
uniref:Japonicin-2 n=2 Tax=Rana japonica TaxID=8402 RepID=JAP2_RANJA|nr:RecName: Full=Japonicin-2 [Rana japonica]